MPELTLKAIEELLDLKLDEKFDVKLAPIQKTLHQHTTILDTIAKDTHNWTDEMTVMRERMKRYEDALRVVAEELHVDLSVFLNS